MDACSLDIDGKTSTVLRSSIRSENQQSRATCAGHERGFPNAPQRRLRRREVRVAIGLRIDWVRATISPSRPAGERNHWMNGPCSALLRGGYVGALASLPTLERSQNLPVGSDADGPYRSSAGARLRCAAARQTGLSLRPKNLRDHELTERGQTGLVHVRLLLTQNLLACAADTSLRCS